MSRVLPIVLLFSVSAWAQVARTDAEYINKVLYPATALLYAQTEDGTMKMRCTATAIEKNADGYVFVTAAHCACNDDTEAKTVSPEDSFFFITSDDAGTKEFLSAKPIACGYRHKGDDFALFQVDTKKAFPAVDIGKDPDTLDAIVNVASPLDV